MRDRVLEGDPVSCLEVLDPQHPSTLELIVKWRESSWGFIAFMVVVFFVALFYVTYESAMNDSDYTSQYHSVSE